MSTIRETQERPIRFDEAVTALREDLKPECLKCPQRINFAAMKAADYALGHITLGEAISQQYDSIAQCYRSTPGTKMYDSRPLCPLRGILITEST